MTKLFQMQRSNGHYLQSSSVRFAILLVVFFAAMYIDCFRPESYFIFNRGAFNATSQHVIRIPATPDFVKNFEIHFDVKSSAVNEEIFQSFGTNNSSIKLGIEPPNRLVMVLFSLGVAPINMSNSFTFGSWHHIDILGHDREHFDVALDGAVEHMTVSSFHQVQSSAEIGSSDFRFRFLRTYLGFSDAVTPKSRSQIANFSFHATYVSPLPVAITILLDLIIIVVILWALAPWLACCKVPYVTTSECWSFLTLATCILLGFVIYGLGVPNGKWAILISLALGAVLSVVIARTLPARTLSSLISSGVLAALAIISMVALHTLPNWISLSRMFELYPLISTFICTSMSVGIWTVCYHSKKVRLFPAWLKYARSLPYALFGLLALRTDSLFAPINALHWDYYLGPIRSIHAGAWPLWDAPSQYGFLDVLIPAILPIHPIVDAFYWFQGVTSLLCASIFYQSLHRWLGVTRFAACVLVAVFIFLSDPLLIGASAYPSSGSIRFIWCYVIMGIAVYKFIGIRSGIQSFIHAASLAWLGGVLWSAESAIYSSVIFFAPIFTHITVSAMKTKSLKRTLREALILLQKPALLLAVTLIFLNVIYHIYLGHGPDWSLYIAYIRTYGSGFGERTISWFGPIWIIASVIYSGVVLFPALDKKEYPSEAYAVITAQALVWIVSSYYLGRAYPIVMSLLSPMIVFSYFTIIRAGKTVQNRGLPAALMIPILTVGLCSTLWNINLPAVVFALKKPDFSAWRHLPQANVELTNLLAREHISPSTPVVYYDTWVAMPRSADGPFDENWLPTPLQQLEQPISINVRDQIISRFLFRHHASGYLIETVNADDEFRSQSWASSLSRFYSYIEIAHTPNYRIERFTYRLPAGMNGNAMNRVFR